MAYKIDTSLVYPLGHLPARIAKDPSRLALRNLMRGVALDLPCGQDVAAALHERVLTNDDLLIGKATAKDHKKLESLAQIVPGFGNKAPLWAYILSEAQVTSWEKADAEASLDDIPVKLGPVGGRIVAGVFAALLNGDAMSYVNTDSRRGGAPFTPIPEFTRDGNFGLAQLINVALGRTP